MMDTLELEFGWAFLDVYTVVYRMPVGSLAVSSLVSGS